MSLSQFRTFLWGSLVVAVDAVVGPVYRWLHARSRR